MVRVRVPNGIFAFKFRETKFHLEKRDQDHSLLSEYQFKRGTSIRGSTIRYDRKCSHNYDLSNCKTTVYVHSTYRYR